MDIETGQASLRAMQLTSLCDQRFSGWLDFSLNHRQQTRFIDQDAQLVFRFNDGQQNIWRKSHRRGQHPIKARGY